MSWVLRFTKQAQKDAKNLVGAGLKAKAQLLFDILARDPFQNPPPFEKLIGKNGVYLRRINIQHRLVYQVFADQRSVKVIRMWTHYD